MSAVAAGSVAVALVLDLAVGEPPERIHPVVGFGRAIDTVDREWNHPGLAGLGVAVVLPLVGATVAWAAVTTAGLAGPLLEGIVAGTLLFTAISLRRLRTVAETVVEQTTTDVVAARASVVALVGRDVSSLGAPALRSAALESVAENLADGLVAPLTAFALGSLVSLPVAAGAAIWVKEVNTCDSMLGYRTHPMGRASARLDDVVAWLPARLTALTLAIVAGRPQSIAEASAWAREPASPNSGWPMATMAVAVDVRLEKPDAYVLNPGAGAPTVAEAARGVKIAWGAGLLTVALAGVVGWY
ncbi:MAG: adenosylcobinamide-phosphate synthase CbiB [Halanaeroarchaeum sp.]